jgi:hypothetical protein
MAESLLGEYVVAACPVPPEAVEGVVVAQSEPDENDNV